MSLRNKERQAWDQPAETNNGSEKKPGKSYTRDFLLSLSELAICKKLPTGLDQSILSEFEDPSQEREREFGSSLLHYGTSPPTRGDVGNYSRSGHGRWDSRPSGRNDRDSDSQSDKDSDSGRHYSSHSRRSSSVPEHDGLLGSGSFPIPSGYAGGASAPKLQASDHYQLNKSNEPYHPPRPYKAIPYSQKHIKDSFNDETFGSSDWTSEDRAEEERKRRASFELLRKEQHNALQESQIYPEKRKGGFDIGELLEDSKEEKRVISKSNESDEVSLQLASNHGSARSTLPQNISAPRPLVPPGFVGSNSEKKIATNEPTQSRSSKVGSSELEANFSSRQGGFLDKLSEQSAELVEPDSGADDISSKDNVRSSKFAHWFIEEEKKPVYDISSGGSNDLLSLIQHSGKDSSHVYDAMPSHHVLPKLSFHSSEHVDTRFTSNLTSLDTQKPEQLYNIKPEEAPAVLTCEDLEKSILSGGCENPTSPCALLNEDIVYVKEQQKSHYDDHAAQRLLCLLQRGDGENMMSSANIDIRSSKLLDDNQVTDLSGAPGELKELNAEKAPTSGQTLTLEVLFGSAFMKELQSVGASTSFLGDLAGSGRLELLDSKVSSIGSSALVSNQTASRASLFPSGQIENHKSDGIEQYLLGFNNQLPVGDTYSRNPVKGEILSSAETAEGMAGKLGALNSMFSNERPGTGSQGHSPFLHSQYGARGLEITPKVQASSSQIRQVNQGPFLHHLDSQDASITSGREFVAPEGAVHHEPPQGHQFPMSVLQPPFPQPHGRLSGFDLPIHHPLLQQMHVPGVPPPHVQPGFHGGSLVPQRSNQVTGLKQDLNTMQGFPLPYQQPNSSPAIIPGHNNAGYRGNHPEGLQRLIEMELRSSMGQKQQFGAGPSPGMQGHELRTGFGYR